MNVTAARWLGKREATGEFIGEGHDCWKIWRIREVEGQKGGVKCVRKDIRRIVVTNTFYLDLSFSSVAKCQ